MPNQPSRVQTVEELRAMPPPTDEEVERRRRALDELRRLALEDELRLGHAITLDEILEVLRDDDEEEGFSAGADAK